MKIKKVLQTDLRDCGVSCLMSILNYYGGYASREYLREITKTTSDGVSVYSLVECASKIGFEGVAVQANINNIKPKLPVIAHILTENKLGHFVVIYDISSNKIKVMDPNFGFKTYTKDEWNKLTTNIYIIYKPKNNILKQDNSNSLLKIIGNVLNKYKLTFIIIIVFSLIYIISSIFISYGFKYLIDFNIFKIKYLLILLILILVLKELTNLFRNYLLNYINHVLDNTLIKEVYNHIIRLPYLYFKNHTKGDIITRIQDIFKIRDLISKLILSITLDFLFIIFILICIFNINYKIGLITIIITILYIVITIIYNNIVTNKLKIIKEKEVIVSNHLIETISSIDTIKGLNIENMLNDKLSFKYDNLQDISFSLHRNIFKENFYKELIKGIGILLIIYMMIIEIGNIGLVFIIYSLLIYYFEPINNLGSLYMDYKSANISFKRIKELLNIECENLNIDKKIIHRRLNGNIMINNLEYSYNGIDDVLKCNNLEIKSNDKVLLYGDSGGGKSTLMKLLVRYLNNYKGSILIDNRDLLTYNLLDIRRKITYVSQAEIIYTDSVYNNIVLNNKISYENFLKIIKLCGVDKIVKNSLLNYDMILDNNGCSLSGGERERIILARSLVKNSDIYIFDESFANLDIKAERILLEGIFKFLKNKTIIVISHRLNNRDLYQKFIMIKRGVVYEY